MEKKILEFTGLLRRAGLPVTLAETLDALEALKLVDFRRESFYTALRSTLVKEAAAFPVFDKLFGLFFSGDFFVHQENRAKFAGYLEKGEKPALTFEDSLFSCPGGEKSCGRQGSRRGGEPGLHFAQIIQIGSQEAMEAFLAEGLESLGELREKHLYQREEALRQIKVFLEWNMGEYQLEKLAAQVDEETRLLWQERIKALEARLKDKLEDALLAKFGEEAMEEILKRTNLNTLDFYRLTNNQVAEIKKKLTRLAHKLAARASMRREKAKRGEINLQQTIRKSMATGGVPIYPAYRRRKPTKPEIMVLCDISGSVATFSEFMLQFVYSVQTRYLSARSFVFVDTVDEVTEYFRGREVEDAIREIYNRAVFSKTGFSDYGLVLKTFNERFLRDVNRKTSIFILGDARNNYRPPGLEEMKKLQETAKKVVWLNPEPIENWNKEDSIIARYAAYVTEIHQCRNLEQLERVIQTLF